MCVFAGVQRSHSSSSSEYEHLASDYSSSALGQLMLMLKHPVVRRSQLLTDRLLRLLGLITDSLPSNTGRVQPVAAATPASAASGFLTVRDVRRRLVAPPPAAPLSAAPQATSAAAQGPAQTSSEQTAQQAAPAAGEGMLGYKSCDFVSSETIPETWSILPVVMRLPPQ